MCSARVHPDFRMPTPNLLVFLTLGEKRGQAYICAGRGCWLLPPCAGEGAVDFSREGARPGPGPRSSRHPPPLTSPESCQNQLGQDYVYWVDLGEASGQGGRGTSISIEKTRVVSTTLSHLAASRGRQRADGWVEHGHPSIRGAMDSVAGPTRGRRRDVPVT